MTKLKDFLGTLAPNPLAREKLLRNLTFFADTVGAQSI